MILIFDNNFFNVNQINYRLNRLIMVIVQIKNPIIKPEMHKILWINLFSHILPVLIIYQYKKKGNIKEMGGTVNALTKVKRESIDKLK